MNNDLKLIKWFEAGMPPIDFNNETQAIMGLIRQYKELMKQNIELIKNNMHLIKESETVQEMNLVLAKEIQRLNGLAKQTA